jgi:4-amino-4-deoxy-L-arabinose transferase-like glycosyltransferase
MQEQSSSAWKEVEPKETDRIARRILCLLAAVGVVLQVSTNGRYGYFRDELYYLAASDHLAWGYVDFAPLIAFLTHASRMWIGDSLHAIRLLPALAFGTEIALTGLITEEMGGKLGAILLSCVTVLTCPVVLANSARLSMNPLEPLFWMGCIYFLLRSINRNEPKLLLWCGVLLGFGLENKHSTVFFIVALILGLLATSQRRILASKWFWIGAALATIIAMPNFLWQYQHHFPTLEDLHNVAVTHKNVELPPIPFVGQQILMLGPISALVWIPGFFFLVLDRRGDPKQKAMLRSLGLTYFAFLALMMGLKAKDYYLAPIYPILFAGGSLYWERLAALRSGFRWLRFAMPLLIFCLGLLAVPMVLPILAPDRITPYMEALGIKIPRTETTMEGRLPQYFSDQFGWPEMVASVADVYNSLPPDQRTNTAILAGNYGGAGAIDFFGPHYGLPKSISAHQNYYYWGPRQYTGETIILLEWRLSKAQQWCGSVEQGPTLQAVTKRWL